MVKVHLEPNDLVADFVNSVRKGSFDFVRVRNSRQRNGNGLKLSANVVHNALLLFNRVKVVERKQPPTQHLQVKIPLVIAGHEFLPLCLEPGFEMLAWQTLN